MERSIKSSKFYFVRNFKVNKRKYFKSSKKYKIDNNEGKICIN